MDFLACTSTVNVFLALQLRHAIIMPWCTVHCRHTVVRLCVGFSVWQIFHIFVSSELQVLKVGQYAKSDNLVR